MAWLQKSASALLLRCWLPGCCCWLCSFFFVQVLQSFKLNYDHYTAGVKMTQQTKFACRKQVNTLNRGTNTLGDCAVKILNRCKEILETIILIYDKFIETTITLLPMCAHCTLYVQSAGGRGKRQLSDWKRAAAYIRNMKFITLRPRETGLQDHGVCARVFWVICVELMIL